MRSVLPAASTLERLALIVRAQARKAAYAGLSLAAAIAAALTAAQEAGLPLEIKIGNTKKSIERDENMNVNQSNNSLNAIEEKLIRQLDIADNDTLTLTAFAEAIGEDEAQVRAEMRGSGRSSKTVQDHFYERFDTPRPEGGKVRTYTLKAEGKRWLSSHR